MPGAEQYRSPNDPLLRPFLDYSNPYTAVYPRMEQPPSYEETFWQRYHEYKLPPTPEGAPTAVVYVRNGFDPSINRLALFDHDDTMALNAAMRLLRNQHLYTFLSKHGMPIAPEDLDDIMNVTHRLASLTGNYDPAHHTYIIAQLAYWLSQARTYLRDHFTDPKGSREGVMLTTLSEARRYLTWIGRSGQPKSTDYPPPFSFSREGKLILADSYIDQGGIWFQAIREEVMEGLFTQSNTNLANVYYKLREEHNIPVGFLSKGPPETQRIRICTMLDEYRLPDPDIMIIVQGTKGAALEALIDAQIFLTNPGLHIVHLDDSMQHIDSLRLAHDKLRAKGNTIEFSPILVRNDHRIYQRYNHAAYRKLAMIMLRQQISLAEATAARAGNTLSTDLRSEPEHTVKQILSLFNNRAARAPLKQKELLASKA